MFRTVLLTFLLAYYGLAVAQPEVIYHVCQRSFYDSNGDQVGDLKGLDEKLDYLGNLGVTSILLLPLYQSVYYHNYFADDFEKIDPEFGTLADYVALMRHAHQKGMKIYMDMETQYVTGDHIWYKDSYGNPASRYSNYLLYHGAGNTDPEPIVYNLKELMGYDRQTKKVATVNLNSPEVLEYNFQLFSYWIDPNKDGKFDDGVDGFRLDHMMDDLDNKGIFKDLFARFWTPLIGRLKKINPRITFTAEQANWGSFGFEYLSRGNVDRVFAFRLQSAIASFDKQKLVEMADTTLTLTPPGKQQIVFIENHDMMRFSSAVKGDAGKLRVGAALNLLIGGIPAIYCGQELGMKGAGGFAKFDNTDGNDIPQREAFEWYKTVEGKGMALWYKDSGPWWTQSNLKSDDGISLEEEKDNPSSLFNYYKKLIALRRNDPALARGAYQTLSNDNANVFSFLRFDGDRADLVIVNLVGIEQRAAVRLTAARVKPGKKRPWRILAGRDLADYSAGVMADLPPYDVQVWGIR